jgi:transcriptional regulator with XRE-family HTH domain
MKYYTDSEILLELGGLLKKYRLSLNMTQKDVALKIGIDRATLSLIENGRPSSLLYFLRLVKLYGKTEDFLNVLRLPEVSPMEMYRLQNKRRKKASRKKPENNKT